jgi:hypothetical protein
MRTLKITTLIIFAFLFLSQCGQKDYDRILVEGITGKGIINKVEDTNVTVNENPQVRLYLTVYSDSYDPFDAVIKMVVSRINIPRKGDWVAVKFDPADNQKVIWIEEEDMTDEIQRELDNLN